MIVLWPTYNWFFPQGLFWNGIHNVQDVQAKASPKATARIKEWVEARRATTWSCQKSSKNRWYYGGRTRTIRLWGNEGKSMLNILILCSKILVNYYLVNHDSSNKHLILPLLERGWLQFIRWLWTEQLRYTRRKRWAATSYWDPTRSNRRGI